MARATPAERVALAAVGVLLLATSCRWVLGGDNGEFATLAAEGGVAHPPGYPLYVLWLRATAFLPAATPAHRAAIATAFLGAATAFAVRRAAVAWGAAGWAATVMAALYALSPLAWHLATHAEVFTLHALLSATLVFAAGPAATAPTGIRRAAVASAAFGLGAANHHTVALLAPLLLYAVARGAREAPGRDRGRVVLALGVGAALGVVPYLALLAPTPPGALAWGETSTLRALLHHFLRGDYGTFKLGVATGDTSPHEHLFAFAASAGRQLLFAPAALAAIGVAAVGRRAPWAATSFAGAITLAGPVLLARFNIPPRGIAAHVVERFYLLPVMLLAVLAAVGLSVAATRVRPHPLFAMAALATSVVAPVALTLPQLALDHGPALETYLRDTLAALPPDAILLGDGDHRLYGFAYAQRALGLRRDVVYVQARLLPHGWYRRRIRDAIGGDHVVADGTTVNGRATLAALVATGRPVYLTGVTAPSFATLPLVPVGTVLKVLPQDVAPPSLEELEVLNARAFEHFHDVGPQPAGSWAADARADYARPWLTLEASYAARGEVSEAVRVRALAGRWLD